MKQDHFPVRGKYVCTACGTTDLQIGVHVEFDSEKKILRHMSCGGKVVLDKKETESDYRHLK